MVQYLRFILLSRLFFCIGAVMKKKTGIILLSLLLTAALIFAFSSMFLFIGGRLISIRTEEVDLSGMAVSDVSRLLRLSSPSRIILRDCPVSQEGYTALSAHFPGCEILWDIPLSCGRYPSDAKEITVSGITEDDIPLYSLFTQLNSIDTRSFVLSEDTRLALSSAIPDCTILYNISIGNAEYDARSEVLSLEQSDLTADEIAEQLSAFPELKEIDLSGSSLSPEEQLSLVSLYPSVRFTWNVSLYGKSVPNSVSFLDFSDPPPEDLSLLRSVAPLFPNAQEIDLGEAVIDPETICELRSTWNGAAIHCSTEAFGQVFSTNETELDFSGTEIDDVSLFDSIVGSMPGLERVILCDCGIADEEMDRLNHRFEEVRFVWTVYFSIYSLRTDATSFCASNVPERNYIGINMTDAQLAPIRYCTDLVALDLGHMTLMTDLSVLKDMLHLRFLILSTNGMNGDISILSTFKDLYYLELFHNTIQDLSPLLECPNLQHLNIGYCVGYDIAPLMEMKQLKRLWIPGNSLTDEQKAALEAALPDTYIYMPRGDIAGSTGGDWRVDEAYYEMRDLLHMHYMPGDAGYHLNDS